MRFFKNVCKLFVVVFLFVLGGFLSPVIFSLFKGSATLSTSDAISVANTYIVFTTFIFAGLAVFIAIIGFVFSQQFAISKEVQLHQLTDELQSIVRDNKLDVSIKLVDIALENEDVRKHFEKKLELKIYQILKEKYEIDADDISSIRESIGG
jgi:hypothetical protein